MDLKVQYILKFDSQSLGLPVQKNSSCTHHNETISVSSRYNIVRIKHGISQYSEENEVLNFCT